MRSPMLMAALLACVLSTPASAHRDGCHRWHSCPSDHGTYTCGDLGYTTYCVSEQVEVPARPVAAAPPTPRAGAGSVIRRTTTNVNLRQSASAASAKVALIPAGTVVNVSGCSAGWCRVSTASHSGYVAQTYLH